jgi:hypothetical protein
MERGMGGVINNEHAKVGLLLLKRMKDYGINPQATHYPFIPFPFLLDRNKPE